MYSKLLKYKVHYIYLNSNFMQEEQEFYGFLEEICRNNPEMSELTPAELIDKIIKEKVKIQLNISVRAR